MAGHGRAWHSRVGRGTAGQTEVVGVYMLLFREGGILLAVPATVRGPQPKKKKKKNSVRCKVQVFVTTKCTHFAVSILFMSSRIQLNGSPRAHLHVVGMLRFMSSTDFAHSFF